MRFFATSAENMDRTGNLPAGTVVDNTVTHPFAFDFYLQAHGKCGDKDAIAGFNLYSLIAAGLVGTARPTHYSVLVDDNKFKPDDLQVGAAVSSMSIALSDQMSEYLQRLTNALCYNFPRATRSVSIVSVAYMADVRAHSICYQSGH
jgi:eukaryotic translation initiation factor 2C